MAIFRECKHSFQIVLALFGKSASTLVFSATSGSSSANLRNPFRTVRTLFRATKVIHSADKNGTSCGGYHLLTSFDFGSTPK